jgi:hypothetical protein
MIKAQPGWLSFVAENTQILKFAKRWNVHAWLMALLG